MNPLRLLISKSPTVVPAIIEKVCVQHWASLFTTDSPLQIGLPMDLGTKLSASNPLTSRMLIRLSANSHHSLTHGGRQDLLQVTQHWVSILRV